MQALFINMGENHNYSVTFSGGLLQMSQKSVKQFMESNKSSTIVLHEIYLVAKNQKWQLLVKVVCIEFQQRLLNIHAIYGKSELQSL